MPRPLVRAARIILIGPPGCGKGTQTSRLLDEFPLLSSLSSGDLLRENVRRRTPIGIQAEKVIKTGGLLPDDTILSLILSELSSRGWIDSPSTLTAGLSAGARPCSSSDRPEASFLLDGFPRTLPQATGLQARGVGVNLAVHLDVPHDAIVERVKDRLVHVPSGRVYNLGWGTKPAKKDGVWVDVQTGEKLTKRPDDEEDVVRKRLRAFEELSAGMLGWYKERGVLERITGRESNMITPELVKLVADKFA